MGATFLHRSDETQISFCVQSIIFDCCSPAFLLVLESCGVSPGEFLFSALTMESFHPAAQVPINGIPVSETETLDMSIGHRHWMLAQSWGEFYGTKLKKLEVHIGVMHLIQRLLLLSFSPRCCVRFETRSSAETLWVRRPQNMV